jgi:hypothetical protein
MTAVGIVDLKESFGGEFIAPCGGATDDFVLRDPTRKEVRNESFIALRFFSFIDE